MKPTLLCALLVTLAACDDGKKKAPAPSGPAAPAQPTSPGASTPAAPAAVPADFKAKVERAWPQIKERGDALKRHFDAARAARAAGDREKMAAEVESGKKVYNDLQDAWAALYYAVDDMPSAQGDACRNWLRSYNQQVQTWQGMAASLKQLSTS